MKYTSIHYTINRTSGNAKAIQPFKIKRYLYLCHQSSTKSKYFFLYPTSTNNIVPVVIIVVTMFIIIILILGGIIVGLVIAIKRRDVNY